MEGDDLQDPLVSMVLREIWIGNIVLDRRLGARGSYLQFDCGNAGAAVEVGVNAP